jgi:hypothetical protein
MADKRISQLVERTDIANNDVVPIVASGATTTNKATISSIQEFMQENLDLGVTSVGITLGTTGTDVSVTGSPITTSGNITINLPTASATNRGLLSSADWTTFNNKQAAGNYVTIDTAQTITAQKTFTTSGSSDTMIISHGSGSGFALDVIKAGNGEAIRVQKTSGSGNAMTISGGNFEAGTIVRTGGTSSQFLKADGSVDSSTYLTTSTAASTYITIATPTTITGVKTFDTGTLILAAAGTANSTHLRNSSGDGTSVSGSNVFGFNSSNNIYVRTQSKGGFIFNFNNGAANRTYTFPDADGTIAVTSNLSAYLPLTGGTLTGALNGTSAVFSNIVTNTSGGFWTGSPLGFLLRNDGNNANLGGFSRRSYWAGGTAADTQIFAESGFGIFLNVNGSTTSGLTLASTGAATFSSSVTANSGIYRPIDNAVETLRIFRGNSASFLNESAIIDAQGGNTHIRNKALDSVRNIIFSLNTDGSTTYTERMRITSGGSLQIGTSSGSGAKTFIYDNRSNSGNVDESALYIRQDGTNAIQTWAASGGTEVARITSTGLTFNGDTAAANALDDYEEGTWTMGISFGGASVGVTYGSTTGTYTKIGRQVTVNGFLALTNKGTSVGNAAIENLPFTTPNNTANYAAANVWLFSVSFANQFQAINIINTNRIQFYEITESGTLTTLTESNFANNSEVIVSLTYFV